jgi:sugar-specific transcriptional regulator TrmB
MLQDEFFTASELSDLSGIHRSRIYDNLRGLEAKRLIVSTDQNPLRFKLVPPKKAVSYITESLISEHQIQLQEISDLGFLLESALQNRASRISVKPQVVPLEEAIFELRTLLDKARTRVWVTKRTSGGIIDWFALRAELGKLLSEGVDIRFLSDRQIGFPFDLRVKPDVPVSFAIIDNTVVSFLIPSAMDEEGQIFVTRNLEYVKFFELTFLGWWKNHI